MIDTEPLLVPMRDAQHRGDFYYRWGAWHGRTHPRDCCLFARVAGKRMGWLNLHLFPRRLLGRPLHRSEAWSLALADAQLAGARERLVIYLLARRLGYETGEISATLLQDYGVTDDEPWWPTGGPERVRPRPPE
jgi:hypothetical protein